MGLTEGPVVQCQEGLQALLGALPAMIQGVGGVVRRSEDAAGFEVVESLSSHSRASRARTSFGFIENPAFADHCCGQ